MTIIADGSLCDYVTMNQNCRCRD